MMTRQSTKQQVILQEWGRLKTDLVGSSELTRINEVLVQIFGPGGAETPASLARLLADHGARLKHPEVLETDTRWREQRLGLLFAHGEIDFTTMASSLESISKLDDLYRQFRSEGDEAGLEQLRELAKEVKAELSRLPITSLAAEVCEWLTIWLQTPQMFVEWLDLRLKSPGFQAKFGAQL